MGIDSNNFVYLNGSDGYTFSSTYFNGSHYPNIHLVLNGTTQSIGITNPIPAGLCGQWGTYNQTSNQGLASLRTIICGITGGVPMPIHGISGATAVDIRIMKGAGGVTADLLVDIVGGRTGETGIKTRYLTSGVNIGEANSLSTLDSVRIQGVVGGGSVGVHVGTGYTFPVNIIGSDGNTSGNIGIFGISGATAVGITANNFNIRGITSTTDSIKVVGGNINGSVSTAIYGFTGGTLEPVYSTGNAIWANIKNGLSLGAVVTATDLDIRNLEYTLDSVEVRGQGADNNDNHSTVPTNISIKGANNDFIIVGGVTGASWSGAAMNVNFVGAAGLTFELCASATFGAEIGITQSQSRPVPVHGSTFATSAIWVAGGTSGEAVVIVGNCGGFLPVVLESSTLLTAATFNTKTDTTNSTLDAIKLGTDHAFGIKSALYDPSNSNASGESLFTLVKNSITVPVDVLKSTVITTQGPPSISVSVSHTRQQSMFTASTGFAGYTAKSLDEFITGATGLTCENGVTIKASRVGPSANEFISIISDADFTAAAGNTGARNASSFPLYHGEEILVKVDNINKISIFYSSLDTSFAPNNTGSGMTFSFIV